MILSLTEMNEIIKWMDEFRLPPLVGMLLLGILLKVNLQNFWFYLEIVPNLNRFIIKKNVKKFVTSEIHEKYVFYYAIKTSETSLGLSWYLY